MRLGMIQRMAWDIAEKKGQHANLDSLDERSQSLIRLGLAHTEVSEALDEFAEAFLPMLKLLVLHRQLSQATQHVKRAGITDASKSKVVEELADVIIRCADLAQTIDVDLESAVWVKMQQNEQRPQHYGTPWEIRNDR